MNSYIVAVCFMLIVSLSSAMKQESESKIDHLVGEPNVEASNGYAAVSRSRIRGSNTVEDDYQVSV